ncbi:hypothetical protein GCM10027570_05150 [Streptomonospora sediminis]
MPDEPVPPPERAGARSAEPAAAVDPDVDLHVPRQRRELRDAPWAVLAAVSAGGAIGGAARCAVGLLVPYQVGHLPWPTLTANITGCLLIGVLMTAVARARPGSRLLRPFAGPGILGGYTTFSAHIGEAHALLSGGAPLGALGYLAVTLLGGLAAVWAGIALTERLLDRGAAPAPHRAGTGGGTGGGEVRP